MRYTTSHWGIYEVHEAPAGPRLRPFRQDPDASPIGLHQFGPELDALRVRRPAVRKSWLEKGPGNAGRRRGREHFVEVSWDEATRLVADEVERVRSGHGNEAIFGGSYGWASAGRFHHAQSQLHRFLNCAGGYVAHRGSYSLAAGNALLPHVVEPLSEVLNDHTSWDVLAEHCELFVAFGGVPTKNSQIVAGGVGRHRCRAGLQAMAAAGTEFVNISPVSDNLACGGPVEWIPIRPGSDTAMMLALAHEIHAAGRHDTDFLARCCVGWDRFESYLTGQSDGCPKNADWAAALCHVPADTIRSLAARMATKRTMINTAWALQRSEHGEQPFWMTIVLAAMLGQIGLPGGGFGLGYGAENSIGSAHASLPGPTLPQGQNQVGSFIPVARIADMLLNPGADFHYDGKTYRYPDIRLVYWAGGNPFHHHQDLARLERAWQKPETIVVHEPFWTASAKRADIVLPVTTTWERDDLSFAGLEGVLVASRAAKPPAGEARDDYAIFERIAERLGCKETFTEGRSTAEWLHHMYDTTRQRWSETGVELPSFETFWEQGLIDLSAHDVRRVMLESFRQDPVSHPLPTPSGLIEIFSQTIAGFALPDCPGHPVWIPPLEWLGGEAAGRLPLHLISDQPDRRLHSQLDASPHSRGGKIAGREPVFMHPSDAAARGLTDGSVVELFNERGSCLAGLRISGVVMPGVIRLSTGGWFDPDHETGRERHGNPNALTADRPASALSQGCTAQSCLVDVRRVTGEISAPRPFDLPIFARPKANPPDPRDLGHALQPDRAA